MRSGTPAVAAWVREALGDHLVDLAAPPNYSIIIGDRAPGARATGFHFLYRSASRIVRTPDPRRLVQALVNHLSSHAPPDDGDRLRLQAVALVGPRGALLAPAVLQQYLARMERRLHARGVRFVDAPLVTVDERTTEVVVPEPVISVDEAAVAAFEAIAPARPDPPVPPGRYPLLGWAFLGEGDTPSRAQAVAIATRMVERGGHELQATLDSLGRVMRTIEPTRLAWSEPPALAAALAELL